MKAGECANLAGNMAGDEEVGADCRCDCGCCQFAFDDGVCCFVLVCISVWIQVVLC